MGHRLLGVDDAAAGCILTSSSAWSIRGGHNVIIVGGWLGRAGGSIKDCLGKEKRKMVFRSIP